jgi:hypothetical protein
MKPVARMQTIAQGVARPRKGAAWLGLSLLLAPVAMLLGGTPASAQVPPAQMPPKSFMNKNTFFLPVIIDDSVRGKLREIQLYVKDDPAKQWTLAAKGQPWEKVFPYRPAQEGEYWFTVVTVDKLGRQMPADLAREGPGVIVVYDATMPQVDIIPLPATQEGQRVQCEVRDANLDLTKTRFEYQTADKNWRAGDAVPGSPNVFCIPQQAAHNGMVRVTAGDRAGNVNCKEFNLGGMPVGALTAQGTPGQPSGAGAPVVPAVAVQSIPQPEKTALQGPVLTGFSATPPRVEVPEPPKAFVSQKQGLPPSPLPTQLGEHGPDLPGTAQVSKSPGVPAVRQLVNSNHVSLEYQIDQPGSNSGVGKVEVWMTADEGQSWRPLGEDPDRRSPVEIDLPGDGVYGVSLVVTNARGFGDAPPRPGDVPDYWIEVDTSRPIARLHSVRPGTGDEAGVLWISWTAQDKNLTATPVDLYYSAKRNGPWTVIARGLKNDGHYRWTPPMEIGPEAFVRMVVSDKAGNSTQCETPQAVVLDDGIRLHGHVIGVATHGAQASPPKGN